MMKSRLVSNQENEGMESLAEEEKVEFLSEVLQVAMEATEETSTFSLQRMKIRLSTTNIRRISKPKQENLEEQKTSMVLMELILNL